MEFKKLEFTEDDKKEAKERREKLAVQLDELVYAHGAIDMSAAICLMSANNRSTLMSAIESAERKVPGITKIKDLTK